MQTAIFFKINQVLEKCMIGIISFYFFIGKIDKLFIENAPMKIAFHQVVQTADDMPDHCILVKGMNDWKQIMIVFFEMQAY